MNRTQKKCFIASGGFHALLLVILFVGPAFLSSRNTLNDMAVLEYIPLNAIDAAFSGGGNPNVKEPPRTTTQPQQQPPAKEPPKPAPPLPKPPEKEQQEKPAPPAPKPPKTEPASKTVDRVSIEKSNDEKVKISTTLVARTPDARTQQRTKELADQRAKAEAKAYNDYKELVRNTAQVVQNTAQGLRENLSSSTSVDTPGPGGAAYANYAQIVKSIYTAAWIVPDEAVADDNATAKVTVRIARDGNVLEARIFNPSGSSAVDRSVQRALNRVDFIRPFPEGAKEKERTFNINFNLKAKRLLG